MCNYEDKIEINITNNTRRTSLIDDKFKVLVYSKKTFKKKLKKLKDNNKYLEKTEKFT
tara:strand:- start:64 stop:237 length:174 start_codon:yes stop_codon:yes gene_type:complete